MGSPYRLEKEAGLVAYDYVASVLGEATALKVVKLDKFNSG